MARARSPAGGFAHMRCDEPLDRAVRATLCIALALGLAACGKSSKNYASPAVASNLTGSIGGTVLVHATGAPVADALASISVGSTILTARTDAAGRYGFDGVPYDA